MEAVAGKTVWSWRDVYNHIDIYITPYLNSPRDNSPRDRLRPVKIYGIPRGGGIVAALVQAMNSTFVTQLDSPASADVIIDDIYDSGATYERYKAQYPQSRFLFLADKRIPSFADMNWIVFPWENLEERTESIQDNVRRIIQATAGTEMAQSEGMLETPDRVARAYEELLSGYSQKPEDVLKWFEDESDEMVVAKNIQFYSLCEHHMLPFFGKAHIGYIPNGKVIGISELSRLIEIFSRRYNLQERITRQVGEALSHAGSEIKKPSTPEDYKYSRFTKGAAVVLEGKHLCMMARGVSEQEATITTSFTSGVFRNNPETKAEFFSLINSK